MGYGFAAFNDDQKFLISDNFENLHFLGKALVDNSKKDVRNGDFNTGALDANACTIMPSTPFTNIGSYQSYSGGNASNLFNGSTPNWVYTGGWSNSPSADADGWNFKPNVYGNPSWVWVDLGCAQVVDSFTFSAAPVPGLSYNQNTNLREISILYSDTQPPSSGQQLGDMTFDSVTYTSAQEQASFLHRTPGACNRIGPSGINCSAVDGFSDPRPVKTRLPHRYWGFAFGRQQQVYIQDGYLNEIVINFPSQPGGTLSSTNALTPRVVHTYTITSSDTPLVFIRPNDYDRWHSLIDQSNVGNTWTFKVLVSGDDNINAPSLFCFVPPEGITANGETHGMVVKKGDNTKTFDSRLKPLVVIDGGTGIPPSVPCNGGTPTDQLTGDFFNDSQAVGLDFDFKTNGAGTYNSQNLNTSVSRGNIMFAASSMAQAVYSRNKKTTGSINYVNFSNYYQPSIKTNVASSMLWWAMYRNSFRLRTGVIDSGWSTWLSGILYTEDITTASQIGWGGADAANGPSGSVGIRPYTDKTINLQNNAWILADASKYE